jgi:hypothetical protein
VLAEAQRRSLLRSMGVDVYRLRPTQVDAPEPGRTETDVAVVCDSSVFPVRLRAQLPRALGVGMERMCWCEAAAAHLPETAAAYVAVGTEAARALGVQLSTMQQNRSIIATTAEASALLSDAASKRGLWQVLKPVARHLHRTD